MNKQLFKSAITVFVFWWIAIALWGFDARHLTFKWIDNSIIYLVLLFISVLIGLVSNFIYLNWVESDIKESLGERTARGLTATIGEVPLNAKPPLMSKSLPDLKTFPDVPEDFFENWFSEYGDKYKEHAIFLKALLRVFNSNPSLPATHVPGGHGGRSLLDHSVLVAYQMVRISNTWKYDGLRDRTGKRVILSLRNDKYIFSPVDPMILIIGLAHDIGKIDSYIFKNGKIDGTAHEHDLIGARMLARMPEIWNLPDQDRQSLILSTAHYHHPMDLPLAPDRRAVDDRTIALMELLIKADYAAGSIEVNGIIPTEEDFNAAMNKKNDSISTVLDKNELWLSFLDLIEETGRVNSTDKKYNLGTICNVQGQNSMRLILREDSLRSAIIQKIGLSGNQKKFGDGRYEITVALLELIDEKGFLVKKLAGQEYAASSAFWEIDFWAKKGKSSELQKITGWSYCIIVHTDVSKSLEAKNGYGWAARPVRGSVGAGRALKKKDDAVSDVDVLVSNDDESDVVDANGESAVDLDVEINEVVVDNSVASSVNSENNGVDVDVDVDLVSDIECSHEEINTSVDQDVISLQAVDDKTNESSLLTSKDIDLSQFIVKEYKVEKSKNILSPNDLAEYLLRFIGIASAKCHEVLGANGEVFVVIPGNHLIKEIVEVNWLEQIEPLKKVVAGNDSRYKIFKIAEGDGNFYISIEKAKLNRFVKGSTSDDESII